MTGFPLTGWRKSKTVLFLCAFCWSVPAGGASAQGSRFESLLEDAQRFIEQQSMAIEQQLERLGQPARPAAPLPTPPLPERNPHRRLPSAEAAPVAPTKPAERADTAQQPVAAAPEPAAAASDQASISSPERNPLRIESDKPAPPPHPSEIAAEDWTAGEIAAADAACDAALAGVVVSYDRMDPLREGICGAPAPVKLTSVGAAPAAEIDPPATLTCAMAVKLARWMEAIVQPAAREHLGEPVVRLRNVASYSCRNRYNTPGKRISEHANANALDIAAFETKSGKVITVLDQWDAKEEASDKPASEPDTPVISRHGTAAAATPAAVDGNSGSIKEPDESAPSGASADVLDAGSPEESGAKPVPESVFLHTVYEGACAMFGTTLGPKANAAHEDHFHVDMKDRTSGGYCE